MELAKITYIIYFAGEICVFINISQKIFAKTVGNSLFCFKNYENAKCFIKSLGNHHGKKVIGRILKKLSETSYKKSLVNIWLKYLYFCK